jgi:uncharacterized protein YgiM (DUF1202 family)
MKNTLALTAAWILSALPCAAIERASQHYGASDNPKPRPPLSADLNGDGRRETIRIASASSAADEPGYRLSVGRHSIGGKLEGMNRPHVYTVDINRADRYKEIVVQRDDLGLNFESHVYWFDGRRLRLMGTISGVEAVFKGDGTVSEQNWRGFWHSTDTFRLTRTRKLAKTPRRFYPVNKAATASQNLPLHSRPGHKRVTATLKPGAKLAVVKSDLKGWYLVRASGGTQGWAAQREIMERTTGLPIGD